MSYNAIAITFTVIALILMLTYTVYEHQARKKYRETLITKFEKEERDENAESA